ncbi:hypothetical protein K2X05_06070 [bacterium]|nr:hypothetical protein [bacterium]
MKKIVFLCLFFLKITGCASYMEELKEKKKRERIFGLDQASSSVPTDMDKEFMLSSPNIKKQCHPWITNGSELVQAHCVWTIQGSASWKRKNNLGGSSER